MRTLLARLSSLAMAAAASLAWPTFVAATPPVDQLGSFAYTCGGLASGSGLPVQNIDLSGLFAPGESVCKENFEAAMSKVTAKVTHTGPRGTGGGFAQALPGGRLRVRASNNAVGDGGEVGGALAGFTDVLRVDAPGLVGEPGVLYYQVRVKGTLESHGPSGGVVFRVLPLAPRTTVWKDWSVATDIVTPDAFLAVDETAVVAASIVFGEQFTLTTVGWAHAGIRAQGGTGHGSVSFDGKKAFRLKGVDHVTRLDGSPVTDYTVTSQAGLPW
ncbi:hypothetical protein [Ideonella sp. YS5]|uniref:hypothetical protein n=1 Tax=Ideonella sp. YS5 TaxID=3453714 RepID=UPI003EF0516C